MKLSTKFMTAVGLLLLLLSVGDVWLSMWRERSIVTDDIKKWTFIFAENVRVSLNTLMREGKMDIRFAIFDGLKSEIKGLKNVRVIRGPKVNELFMLAREKEIIPREEKRIGEMEAEIADLRKDLKAATDADEKSDLKEEIAGLQRSIEKSREIIDAAKKPIEVDEREQPLDKIDWQVLKSGETAYLLDGDNARVVVPYKVQKKGCSETSGCHRYGEEGDVLGGISIEFSLAGINEEIKKHNIETALFGVGKLVIILVALLILLTVVITRPVTKVGNMVKGIAAGKGDLTKRIDLYSNDEVGTLSRWFNLFMDGLQSLVREVFHTSRNISAVSDEVKHASSVLQASSQAQREAIDETSSSIQEMSSSIQAIAFETENQLKSTEEASASILEMLASISEVAEHADQLANSADKSSSSVHQIVASLKEVGLHVDDLFEQTAGVVSAATEIDAAVREVTTHVREKALLAEKVRENASSLGMAAIRQTVSGMEKIKAEVSATASVIDRLEQRSDEIGRIINVIEEVAETTNLLSLNAAIIAAQAGEHGRGFAVVADEVKSLARRTASSTKEITKLISVVQQEVAAAKKSMVNSSSSVEEGVKLSKEAGGALSKIIESAESSLEMARKVEVATNEQARVLTHVMNTIQKINDMVEEIKRATDEQAIASTQIVKATEEMRESTQMVRQSTKEQSRESDHITKIIADVTNKMHSIARATAEQQSASQIIVKAIETMRDEIEKNVSLSVQLEGVVKELDEHQGHLKEKVGSFKIE